MMVLGQNMAQIKMKTSTKIKTFIIIFLMAITVVITARHFIGLHFKKKI